MFQLEKLPGHVQVKTHLKKLLLAPPGALLFEGPKGVGKASFAKSFAHSLLSDANPHKLLSGNHPDLRELYPEGKAHIHPMQVIKQLIEQNQLPPYESKRKVFIIYDADRMLPSSSNALLKILEEPPSYAHFILVTSHPELILTTISSRCFRVPFFLLSDEELIAYIEQTQKKSTDETRQIAWLSNGSLIKAQALAEKKDHRFFSLLTEIGAAALRQSYSILFRSITELESFVEKDSANAIEEVLSALYFWYRDLHLLKLGGDVSLLFFQVQEEELKKNLSCPLPDLLEIQKRMQRIQLALKCHVNLRHCLTELLI